MTPPRAAREYGLDWLRVLAFGILILYHTGMFFVPWPWHVKNKETSEALAWGMIFFSRWRLPLLFFISGCGVCFALRRRTPGAFAGERVRRLLIPLLFGMFVVVPPQIYFERLDQGTAAGYAAFYGTVFRFVPYPQGNLSWHHLWFVAYLLVYSLTLLPVFAWLKGSGGRAAIDRLAGWCEHPGVIYVISLPSLAVALTLGRHWPVTHNLFADWANLTGSMLTFLWGFVFASSPKLLELVQRRRAEWLAGAMTLTVLFYLQRLGWVRLGRFANEVVGTWLGMLWIFTWVGFARRYLNRDSPALRYANEAVYPFYIAHQTITVAAGYYMAAWDVPVAVKFVLLACATFLGSWLVFELARRTTVTRLLFGLKLTRA